MFTSQALKWYKARRTKNYLEACNLEGQILYRSHDRVKKRRQSIFWKFCPYRSNLFTKQFFSVTKKHPVYPLAIPLSEPVPHFPSNLVLEFWDQFLMEFRFYTLILASYKKL